MQCAISKREVIREIGIHISVLNKYLDTSQEYKGMLFFYLPSPQIGLFLIIFTIICL